MFSSCRPTARGFTLVESMFVLCVMSMLLAVTAPHVVNLGEVTRTRACVCNLLRLDAAKKQYALDHRARATQQPDVSALVPYYLPNMPACPSGGSYRLNPINTPPTCSLSAPGQGQYAASGLYYHGISQSAR